jgi:hypothetical protein
MIKVIIAGGREFSNEELLTSKCDEILTDRNCEIVSGGARGADRLGEFYAIERNLPISRFPADWGTYGKRAGFLRNAEMADYADELIAFWDGQSKGTKHMIDLANQKGLVVHVIHY